MNAANLRRSGYKTSMSVALGLGLGFFVLTAVASVLAIGLISGYQSTTALLAEKAELLVSSEVRQIALYLDAAQRQVDFIADQISANSIEPGTNEEFTNLLSGTLAATPHIVAMLFTTPEYRLIGAERQDFETVPLFQTIRGDDDLRQRIDEAKARGNAYWAAPIWREAHGQAFLNAHRPVFVNGVFAGVLSTLVSSRALSEDIADLESDFGANAFILYGRDAVLAHPLLSFGYAGLTRLEPFPRQAVFGDPVISSMWQERERTFLQRLEENMMGSNPGVRFVRFGEQAYVVLYRALEGYTDKPVLVGTYLESRSILTEVQRLKVAIVLCFAISVVSSLTAAYIGRQIAKPIRRLAQGARQVTGLKLEDVEPIPENIFRELNDTSVAFNQMVDGLKWFERYVPRKLVRRLLDIYSIGGVHSENRDIVIMFTDILGFTTLSETLTAREAADLLNTHFSLIAQCVDAEEGTIDKYIGDSVMAIWSAPDEQADAADRACRAALAIRNCLETENRLRSARGEQPIAVRIGLHRGNVIHGNIGSPGRINYTVIGDPVNVAERIMEMNNALSDPKMDVSILISGAVWSSSSGSFACTDLGQHRPRGRREDVLVMSLDGPASH